MLTLKFKTLEELQEQYGERWRYLIYSEAHDSLRGCGKRFPIKFVSYLGDLIPLTEPLTQQQIQAFIYKGYVGLKVTEHEYTLTATKCMAYLVDISTPEEILSTVPEPVLTKIKSHYEQVLRQNQDETGND